MEKGVTQKDIAAACGVTKATVSMVLSGSEQISRETADRVRAAAERLGYDIRNNYAARRMAFQRRHRRLPSRVIGISGPNDMLNAPYFLRVTQGLWQVLSQEHYAILTVGYEGADWRAFVTRDEIDGLIAMGGEYLSMQLSLLRAHPGFGDRPTVALVQRVPDCLCAVTDDAQGAYEACRCLLELGHRRFLAVAMDADLPKGGHEARRAGMIRAFADVGLSWEKQVRPFVCPKPWMNPLLARQVLARCPDDPAGAALVAAVRAAPRPTALLCDNDPIALHAYAFLTAAGVDVPRQVSLVGFDDSDPLPAPDGSNRLSSVSLPLEDLGRAGARLMVDSLREEAPTPQEIVLPTRFVRRASIGPAPLA